MIVAHFTGDDVTSAALVFGLALLFLGWKETTRRGRRAALRFGVLGAALLVLAVVASVTH